ncbi:hypothetical protein GGI15_002436 [Coemansia interrupta]|uniref:RTA1-like protein n=1 Tax=Coemansia interrupta TaxID=1126814 RepID=A0A9W8HI34_9FUNG|nr:hypothetical protein GGI15_002436 [Coemansia interrupta]
MPSAEQYFTYTPVNVAPQVCACVFFIVAIISITQVIRARSARWLFILAGTAIAESAGYVFRAICISNASLGLYIAMMLLLLVSPNALALYNYRIVGVIARQSAVADVRALMRPKFITRGFFISDVLSFLLQMAGGGMMATESMAKTGKYICIFGLAIQLLFLSAFTWITIVIMRDRRYKVLAGPHNADGRSAKRRLFVVVLFTTILIYVRSIYRLIEFIDGYGGKIYGAEWAFYVFDMAMILAFFVSYIVVYVGHHFPRDKQLQNNEYLMHPYT